MIQALKTGLMIGMIILGVTASASAQTSQEAKEVSAEAMKQLPKGGSEEALFNTLNETLEENRKIRATMKEVQQALQKKTIENEDLKTELRKLEALALERNRELGLKVADLDKQIQASKDAAAAFDAEKAEFRTEKKKILEETRQSQTENSRLRKMLANSVLEEEKETIVQMARENGAVAERAQSRVTQLNTENQTFRANLAAAYYEMGNLYFKIKSYPEAVAAYKKVLEYDPANSWAYHNLAVIEDYYLNDRNAAYEHYQLYLNYKPVEEEAAEVRRRVLDLNLLQKVNPGTPLEKDFDKLHHESRNAKL